MPPPENLLFNFSDINSKCRRTIRLRSIRGDDVEQASRIIFNTEPPRSFFGNVNYLKEQLDELTKDDWNIYIFADSINQSLRIKEMLKDFPSVEIIPLSISSGFIIPEEKILVIQENEILDVNATYLNL